MRKIKPVHMILFGFMAAIFIGSLLLSLPFATSGGERAPYLTALFTSTTSVCVTGLVVETTAEYWSTFGQVVILLLIQLGGLGIITMSTGIFLIIGKRVTLKDRLLIQESYNLNTMSGLVDLIKEIIIGSLFIESIGALLLATRMIPEFGWRYGIWASIFNSVSAFCNAGMDIVHSNSYHTYVGDPIVNFTTMGLIIFGGLGFIVWKDLGHVAKATIRKDYSGRRALEKINLHSKIVLIMTAGLIVIGTIFILVLEYGNPQTLGKLSFPNKVMAAMFQSVTTRTAGFETISQGSLTTGSALISMILMFIGGSPVGTAGGIKTMTLAVVVLCIISVMKQEKQINLFHRSISMQVMPKALTIIMLNLSVLFISMLIVLISNNGDFLDTGYECVSALGTVGLTRGLTPHLTSISRVAIIVTMYLGRVGPVSIVIGFATRHKQKKKLAIYPEEEIVLG